jgi:hypothetical protein
MSKRSQTDNGDDGDDTGGRDDLPSVHAGSFHELMDDAELALKKQLRQLDQAVGKKFNVEHAEQARHLARAVAALGATKRQYSKDVNRAVAAMGAEEKQAVIVRFFGTLPRDRQLALLQELMRVANEARTA